MGVLANRCLKKKSKDLVLNSENAYMSRFQKSRPNPSNFFLDIFLHDFRVGVTGSSAILSILGGGRPRHHCEPKQPSTGIRGALGLGSLIRLSEKDV